MFSPLRCFILRVLILLNLLLEPEDAMGGYPLTKARLNLLLDTPRVLIRGHHKRHVPQTLFPILAFQVYITRPRLIETLLPVTRALLLVLETCELNLFDGDNTRIQQRLTLKISISLPPLVPPKELVHALLDHTLPRSGLSTQHYRAIVTLSETIHYKKLMRDAEECSAR